AYEVLALFSDNYDQKPYDIVRNYWRANPPARSVQDASMAAKIRELESKRDSLLVNDALHWPELKQVDEELDALKKQASYATATSAPTNFETWWRKCLHDGFIPGSALPTKTVSLKSDWASSLRNAGGAPALPATSSAQSS